ncbi:MAG: hypothetical protein FRX49_09178 [Trebouxia sp. A1-2]|nr:MAG: hypothetical protein FRX49_09178 [Trebouxia sp. A1-2]
MKTVACTEAAWEEQEGQAEGLHQARVARKKKRGDLDRVARMFQKRQQWDTGDEHEDYDKTLKDGDDTKDDVDIPKGNNVSEPADDEADLPKGLKHTNAGADAAETRGSGEATHQVGEPSSMKQRMAFWVYFMVQQSKGDGGGPPHLHTPAKV